YTAVFSESWASDQTKVVADISAKGHTLGEAVKENEVAATCTMDGSYDSVEYCTVCGTEISRETITVSATGHTIEIRNAKDATCTETGYTGDEECTVCGETVKIGEVIPAVGHIWGKGVVTKEPTSTASGTRTYTCTVCGKTRTVTIPEAGGTLKDGLVLDDDGVFRYYQNNAFAEDYIGVVPYDGGLFFIKNGLIDFDANELCLYEDVWYYVSQGQVQLQYTGLAIHDGAWFYVTDGILDTTVNGLIPYDGEQFLVAAGRLVLEYSGLWLNSVIIGGDNQWYFIGSGMVQNVSCVALYDGAWFVVENGILDTDYNGTIEYDGALFHVVNGQLYS
ncbi:MAG: hypothetical protein LUD12_07725, partial [Lachnospiraceae bacterium]|nr:hypothetical protein [Lachnospiraceae bacterium]